MRQLDCNNVYFDQMGRPLKGRVHFYEKGTTTDLAVYGSDGTTQLANPMYTTNGKLSPQVFLQDKDYTIYWEAYLGKIAMTVDDDENNWKPAGTAISLHPVVTVEFDNVGLVCCENIDAVRALNPSEIPESMVTLLGFSEKGDKPAINYIWDASSTASDDGCTVLKATSKAVGRWLIVASLDMDCRHFGIFPAETMAGTTDAQALAISAAHVYAVNNGIRICMVHSGAFDVGYYRLNAGAYNHLYSYDSNARFIASSAVTVTQVDDRPFYFDYSSDYSGTFTIYGEHLRLSYCKGSMANVTWKPSDRFYIDNATQTAAPSTIDCSEYVPVFIVSASKSYTFQNLEYIEGKRLPSGIAFAFKNSAISDKLFASPDTLTMSQIQMVNCSINIADFTDVSRWLSFKESAGDYVFDLQGRSVTDSVTLPQTSKAEFINGTMATITTTTPLLTFRNFTVTDLEATSLAVLTCYGSSLAGASITPSAVYAHSSTLSIAIGSASSRAALVEADGTAFGGVIHATKAVCNGCSFAHNVNTYASSENVAEFFFNGCTFTAGHNVNGYDSGTSYTLKGSWVGNTFGSETAIQVLGTPASSGHEYAYKGNGGTALPEKYGLVDYLPTVSCSVSDLSYKSGMVSGTLNAVILVNSKEFFGIKASETFVASGVITANYSINMLDSNGAVFITLNRTKLYPFSHLVVTTESNGTEKIIASLVIPIQEELIAYHSSSASLTVADNGTTIDVKNVTLDATA